jgi:putative ABC transport system permease protein
MTKTVKYRNNSVEGTEVQAVTHSLAELWNLELGEGRFFTEKEAESGLALAVLGSDVAEGLFDGGVALGKKITLMGRKVQVIGVVKKQGTSVFGNDFDQKVLVPTNFVRKLIGQSEMDGAAIMVKPKPGIELPRMKDEVRGIMRSLRRLKPKAEDNFALNENSMVSGGLDAIFSIIGIAGTVIGGFSILVGGFGIANIMFVSVRERTNQIGIQKAVGAKRWFLLTQFLAEAVVLSVIGGAIGILLVGLAVLISKATSFDLYLTVGNVITGVLISVFIGLISGLLPAIQASRLDPVEAIRQGI